MSVFDPRTMRRLRRDLRRARHRCMFVALRALVHVSRFSFATAIGTFLGEVQFRFDRRARLRYTRDLAFVLGLAPDDPAAAAILRQAYRTNNAAVLEILSMFDRRHDETLLVSHVALEGERHLKQALAGGRGAILLGTHSGNGALLAVRLAAAGYSVTVLSRQARMMSDGFFEEGMARYGIEGIRANTGIKAYARMLAALREGRVVYLMMDQGASNAKDGFEFRFLGKQMPMPAGVAQLMRHARAPLLPVVTVGATPVWRFEIEPPLPGLPTATLETDVHRLVELTERQVLLHPQLWSWHHRRWRDAPLAATSR